METANKFSAAPLLAAALCSIVAFADEEVVSTTGKLTFGGAESGFACRGLEFSRCEFDQEKAKFVCAGKDAPGLWKLVFRAGPTGAEKVLEAGCCTGGGGYVSMVLADVALLGRSLILTRATPQSMYWPT